MVKLSINLGKSIRAIREQMKLSRAAFSELIDMSEDGLGLIERGITTPKLENLIRIAQVTGLSIDKLVEHKPGLPQKSQKIQALSSLNNYLKTKSPHQIELLHEVAKDIFSNTRKKRKRNKS